MSAYASIALPPPLTRSATNIVPPSPSTPSFFIDNARKSYKYQYSNIYFIRLLQLRKVVEENALRKWKNVDGNPALVPRVLEVEKGFLCYVVGTVYMDMPLKPNVMEDVARDQSIPPPPPLSKFFSPEDSIMLEDESGRIRLVGDRIKQARLVTGVIIGALGMETPGGDFEVIDYCFAGMAPQAGLEKDGSASVSMDIDETSNPSDEWVGLISGLDIGSASPSDAQIQMLVEYLTGEGGDVENQVSASQISRLVIAGDSLAAVAPIVTETALSPEDRKARKYGQDTSAFSPHPVLSLSSTLHDIASAMPLHILPGESDPSGIIMPQQPFPRAMFGDAARYPTLACETNPTYLTVATEASASPYKASLTRTLLVNSGQPLNDMFKYLPTPPNTRLSMVESTLHWRHIAPTAPDTLWCHPYRDEDPFLIKETPDIYVVGGQKKFGTKLVTDRSEDSKGKDKATRRCRVILVPSFALTGLLVLVNLRTLTVKRINFAVRGMTSGGEAEVVKEELVKAPSPTPAEPLPSAPKSSMDYEII